MNKLPWENVNEETLLIRSYVPWAENIKVDVIIRNTYGIDHYDIFLIFQKC